MTSIGKIREKYKSSKSGKETRGDVITMGDKGNG